MKVRTALIADLFGGPDLLWVVLIIAVLFGSSQIPKIARSIGSAQNEFKKGLEEGKAEADKDTKSS